ncbi:hypothetical protein OE749_09695 [Aestuariibacter sp. AA17]|uniref:Uncharacterized protein n=1 Tax=Fluctibacter corallii TaxID=2984329 RepID=A0ABT3A8N3_9ALTE|nr:hypothetical protein [Aestuariibacter sp. AA17]MCV2884968.1 hypothetical protein [Aestuariibacter sp. AA17]
MFVTPMYIDDRVEHAVKHAGQPVPVILTCSGSLTKVESALTTHNIPVTGSTPEFLVLHAEINQQQLSVLEGVKGIGSIELDENTGTF